MQRHLIQGIYGKPSLSKPVQPAPGVHEAVPGHDEKKGRRAAETRTAV